MSTPARPLRILHIILVLKPTNGQYNEHCLPLLGKREITICTYFRSTTSPPAGITLFEGDDTFRGFHRALRAALEAREHDVIHVHTPHAGVLLLMTLLRSGWYRKLAPSTVHTVQNSFQNFSFRNKLLFLPSFVFCRRLVFCSNAAYQSFPALLKWLGRGRMSVVQNAVHLDRIDEVAAKIATPRGGAFTVATVGLIEMKNPLTVLEAFRLAHDPASKLVFIGEGHLRGRVSQEALKAGLHEHVAMTGLIERDGVFEQFGRADLFVSASWGEGLPVAVLEAMASRRPVILSDIPPHREIAEGVDFVPLVAAGDAEGFAEQIKRFRAMPASQREAIGLRCRKLIEERFGLPSMHAGYARVYAEVTGKDARTLLGEIGYA